MVCSTVAVSTFNTTALIWSFGTRFTVNFLRGNDIAMHINPRFNEGGKQVLVRNHKLGDQWGPEERTLQTPFPFVAGQQFEVRAKAIRKDRTFSKYRFLWHCIKVINLCALW